MALEGLGVHSSCCYTSCCYVSRLRVRKAQDERQIAVMKKAHDVQKDTGSALVELVKQATPPMPDHVGTLVNVLA